MTSRFLEAALRYAARGWPVFPLAPRSKIPLRGSRGFKDATTDTEVITKWWREHPTANIGIATGPSSFVALDIDPRNGGLQTIDELQARYGELPPTIVSVTGGGGRHHLFRCPDGLRCSGEGGLGNGVERKAEGGYVVAPPSIHPSGQPYRWDHGPDEQDLAPMPKWVAGGVCPSNGDGGNLSGFQVLPPPADGSPVEPGGRNHAATSLTGQYVQDGLTLPQVLQKLHIWNNSNPEPLPRAEIEKVVRSVWKADQENHPERHGAPQNQLQYQFRKWDEIMKMPDPEWLVREVLPEGGLVTLYGQSGGGKTFVALDLALRIATGLDWWGKRSVRKGLVAYIAGEGVGGLKNRIRAWLKDHQELGATALDDTFFLLDTVPPLLNPMALRGLVEAVEALPAEPVLVVVDTLALALPGADENSAQDVGRAVDACKWLQKRFGSTVLLVHHTRKSGDVERGSSALRGACDVMLQCSKGEMGEVILDPTKIRDGEPFDPIHLFLQSTEVGTNSEGKPVKSATLIPAIPGIFADSFPNGKGVPRPPFSKVSKGPKLQVFPIRVWKKVSFRMGPQRRTPEALEEGDDEGSKLARHAPKRICERQIRRTG